MRRAHCAAGKKVVAKTGWRGVGRSVDWAAKSSEERSEEHGEERGEQRSEERGEECGEERGGLFFRQGRRIRRRHEVKHLRAF